MIGLRAAMILPGLLVLTPLARAAEPVSVDLVISNHRFQPAEIHVPAQQSVVIHVRNTNSTAEEFDSTALRIEKVFAGAGEGVVRLHPLQPGRYPFMGEYHPDTAQGVVIAQ